MTEDLVVTVTPTLRRTLEAMTGNELESTLTVALQRRDPSVRRVHVHADEVLVEYPAVVHRYGRLVIEEEARA